MKIKLYNRYVGMLINKRYKTIMGVQFQPSDDAQKVKEGPQKGQQPLQRSEGISLGRVFSGLKDIAESIKGSVEKVKLVAQAIFTEIRKLLSPEGLKNKLGHVFSKFKEIAKIITGSMKKTDLAAQPIFEEADIELTPEKRQNNLKGTIIKKGHKRAKLEALDLNLQIIELLKTPFIKGSVKKDVKTVKLIVSKHRLQKIGKETTVKEILGEGSFKTGYLIEINEKDEKGKKIKSAIKSAFNNIKKENPTDKPSYVMAVQKWVRSTQKMSTPQDFGVIPGQDKKLTKQGFFKSEIEPVITIREKLRYMDPKDKQNLAVPRAFECYGEIVLVSEFWNGKDLRNYEPSSPQAALKASIDVATGITVLHEKNIIHRDIAARNILRKVETIDGEKQETHGLTDFGRTKFLGGNEKIPFDDTGSPIRYMAPEEIRDFEASKKTDVYAFGMTMLELHLGRTEWKERIGIGDTQYAINIRDSAEHKESGIPDFLYKKLCVDPSSDEPTKFQKLDGPLKDIIFTCLQKDPNDRPEMREIKEMLEEYSKIQLIST